MGFTWNKNKIKLSTEWTSIDSGSVIGDSYDKIIDTFQTLDECTKQANTVLLDYVAGNAYGDILTWDSEQGSWVPRSTSDSVSSSKEKSRVARAWVTFEVYSTQDALSSFHRDGLTVVSDSFNVDNSELRYLTQRDFNPFEDNIGQLYIDDKAYTIANVVSKVNTNRRYTCTSDSKDNIVSSLTIESEYFPVGTYITNVFRSTTNTNTIEVVFSSGLANDITINNTTKALTAVTGNDKKYEFKFDANTYKDDEAKLSARTSLITFASSINDKFVDKLVYNNSLKSGTKKYCGKITEVNTQTKTAWLTKDVRESSIGFGNEEAKPGYYQVNFLQPLESEDYCVIASGCTPVFDPAQSVNYTKPWNLSRSLVLGNFANLQPYDLTPTGFKLKWDVPTASNFATSKFPADSKLNPFVINAIVYGPEQDDENRTPEPNTYSLTVVSVVPDEPKDPYEVSSNVKMQIQIKSTRQDTIFAYKIEGGFGARNNRISPYKDLTLSLNSNDLNGLKNAGITTINLPGDDYLASFTLNSAVEKTLGEIANINLPPSSFTETQRTTLSNYLSALYSSPDAPTVYEKESASGIFPSTASGYSRTWELSDRLSPGPYILTIIDVSNGSSWRFKFRPPSKRLSNTYSFPGYIYEVDAKGDIIKDQVFLLCEEANALAYINNTTNKMNQYAISWMFPSTHSASGLTSCIGKAIDLVPSGRAIIQLDPQ